jgi:hypothetical protein
LRTFRISTVAITPPDHAPRTTPRFQLDSSGHFRLV